jgi:cytochrome c peroxidase
MRLLLSILSVFVLGQSATYDWKLPPGFPVPHVPADNPMSVAKVALGRHLSDPWKKHKP